MTAQVVVVGSINIDVSVRCARLPEPGETVLGNAVQRSPGGKGANQAVASCRAGSAATAMVGAVGDDPDGDTLRSALASAGVDVSAVDTSPEAPTGMAVISVDDRGENTIVVVPGANSAVTVDDRALTVIEAADVLLAQLEIPQEIVLAAALRRRPGAPFILNAAPATMLADELAHEVDLLIVNEHEALTIAEVETETKDADAALGILSRSYPAVLMTLGARGSVLRRAGRDDIRVPAPRVAVVDTTAAGDTFCGVLAAAIARSEDIEQAMVSATAAAALSVQRPGAQESIPTFEETEQQIVRRHRS